MNIFFCSKFVKNVTQTAGGLPYKTDRDTSQKFEIKPREKTNLSVPQAFLPLKGTKILKIEFILISSRVTLDKTSMTKNIRILRGTP